MTFKLRTVLAGVFSQRKAVPCGLIMLRRRERLQPGRLLQRLDKLAALRRLFILALLASGLLWATSGAASAQPPTSTPKSSAM
jgi:hypothetical protein